MIIKTGLLKRISYQYCLFHLRSIPRSSAQRLHLKISALLTISESQSEGESDLPICHLEPIPNLSSRMKWENLQHSAEWKWRWKWSPKFVISSPSHYCHLKCSERTCNKVRVKAKVVWRLPVRPTTVSWEINHSSHERCSRKNFCYKIAA